MENEKVKECLHICLTEEDDCTRCSYHKQGYPFSCRFDLMKDAFAAIEELMAQVKDKDFLIQQQADEIERLRRDVKKQHEKMIELAKRLPHWVSVEERVPDDSREVIIFHTSGIIGVGSFIRPNWYQWYSGGGLPVDVTHWMPMPEPPKEVQDGQND